MPKASSVALLVLSWAACCAARAQDRLNVTVELPDVESWTQITNQVAGEAYSREWVPRGHDADSAGWLIAAQKLPLDENLSADEFLERIYELLAMTCTSSEHEEPERHRIGRVRGAVGRTICSHRLGTSYGVFSDQLVIVEDGFAYVVTSEIRIPPMVVAGVLSFDAGTRAASRTAALEFTRRDELSRALVRERVGVDD